MCPVSRKNVPGTSYQQTKVRGNTGTLTITCVCGTKDVRRRCQATQNVRCQECRAERFALKLTRYLVVVRRQSRHVKAKLLSAKG